MPIPMRALVALQCLVLAAAFGCSSENEDDGPNWGGGGSGAAGAAGQGSGGDHAGASAQGGGSSGGAGSSSGGAAVGGTASGGSGGRNGGSGGSMAGTGGGGDSLAGDGGMTDGGAGSGNDELIDQCLSAPVLDDVRTEALHFTGDGVNVAIVRRVDPDAVGTSGTIVWLAERFGLVRGALAACVSTLGDLKYTVSHHNFDDQMNANSAGQTWVFTQTREDYAKPTQWSVSAKQGNSVLWGPISLTLVSCQRLEATQDCAPTYQ